MPVAMPVMHKTAGKIALIPVHKIVAAKDQPRRHFDFKELESLSDSIRKNGVLQPLCVKRGAEGYELIAGERRLRAAYMAGLSEVPCIVMDADERRAAILSLVENVQREDLHFFDEAQALEKIINLYGLTQEQAAAEIGKSQPSVANKLRLLRIPREQADKIQSAGLSERHARALIRVENDDRRAELLQKVIAGGLNVAQTEELIERALVPHKRGFYRPVIKDLRLFVNTINKAVRTMQRSGLGAGVQRTETDTVIEYRVTIQKTPAMGSVAAGGDHRAGRVG